MKRKSILLGMILVAGLFVLMVVLAYMPAKHPAPDYDTRPSQQGAVLGSHVVTNTTSETLVQSEVKVPVSLTTDTPGQSPVTTAPASDSAKSSPEATQPSIGADPTTVRPALQSAKKQSMIDGLVTVISNLQL